MFIEEAQLVPYAKASLMMEHEYSLPDAEFEDLAHEPKLANGWVTTSSYTARTLYENGVPHHCVHVVPYGVDSTSYPKRMEPPLQDKPLTVIFVGTLSQRKGLSYLLDAVRYLNSQNIRVLLCGRGRVDEHLLEQYKDLSLEIKTNLSHAQLIQELYKSDVFVLPSLVEGFAHVILEAMSCGLPIIATTNTCAPDVVDDGAQGFIIPIRDAQAIADRLSWCIEHRAELGSMGDAAAERARQFTWERFRKGVREAYRQMVDSSAQSDSQKSSAA
jgi:glycosyltransferase involved in cell wall biosynthesis